MEFTPLVISTILTDLVKDIVPEELEHVAVAVLGPAEVAVQLGPVHHRAQLGQQPEQPGRLHLLGQLALESVAAAVGSVELQGGYSVVS